MSSNLFHFPIDFSFADFIHKDKYGISREWRIEGWKGNYLNMGIGGEIGLYCRTDVVGPTLSLIGIELPDETSAQYSKVYYAIIGCITLDTIKAIQYHVVDDNNMMYMSFNLYHGAARPENLIMVRPTTLHWWITGFRRREGQIPANELTMKFSISFFDENMARKFIDNFVCGYSSRGAGPDKFTYMISRNTVTVTWGDVSK